MARLGFFYLPWLGHLNPLAGLAHALVERGHEVTLFHLPEFADEARSRGLSFQPFGEGLFAPGTFARRQHELSQLTGDEAVRAALAISQSLAEALLTHPPAAELDLWVVDQLDYAAATLAAATGQPFVTAILTLLKQNEEGIPGFNGERYSEEPSQREREKQLAARLADMVAPFRDYLDGYRRRAGLSGFSYDTLWSPLAQIAQQPAEFEFPRKELPPHFHFTGPFARPAHRPAVPFPWERLNGKPLIYASLGTAQHRNAPLLRSIVEATRDLDAQLVLSLGVELPDLPQSVVTAPFVPQLEILERCALMITHAGMNSTLECLAAGVPMVALPLSHDQPGIAARIEWTGTGLRGTDDLAGAVRRVLHEDSFRANARRFQRLIAERNGLGRAADIVEQVLRTGRPVLRA